MRRWSIVCRGLRRSWAFRGGRQLAAIRANGENMKQVRQRFLNRSFENVLVEALMGAGSLAVLTSGAVLVSQGDLLLRYCRC